MLINNLPAKWDIEVDLVSIGSGIGGLSAAITAHDNGLKAIVLEKSEQVGGVTALSQGQVWIPGNHHATEIGVETWVDDLCATLVAEDVRLAVGGRDGARPTTNVPATPTEGSLP